MPMPKRPLDDHEQETLSKLAQHMGNPLDEFDMAVGDHIDRLIHEGNYRKMHAAQTGGASEDLGPSEIETQQVKQRTGSRQQAAAQGALKAQQAQMGQSDVNAPPAPSGPIGTSEPYAAQRGAQPPPNVQPPGAGAQGPPPAAPDQDEEEG